MSKRKNKQKKKLDPYAPCRVLYWYERDNFVPPGILITLNDVGRWKEIVAERYHFFYLMIKFRCEIDRDRNILADTTELAFWLTWKSRPEIPEDVEYQVFYECLDNWLDQCYGGYGFIQYVEPGIFRPDDESLSWHSILNFINSDKNPDDPGRDTPKPDEDGWPRINPIIEMLEDHPHWASRSTFDESR